MSNLPASNLFDEGVAWSDIATAPNAFASLLLSADFQRSALRVRPGHVDKPMRAASVNVYGAMFNRYIESLHSRGATILSATTADVQHFLTSLEATSRIRWRYVRLLERVYAHLVERGLVQTNPVSPVAAKVALKSPGQDAPMATLTPQQVAAVLSHVHAPSAFAASALSHNPHNPNEPGGSDATPSIAGALRASALVSLLVGAGLTVSELRHLRRSDLRPEPPGRDWTIRIARPTTIKQHDTKLGAAWVPPVSRWLTAEPPAPRPYTDSALLFPSSRGGPLVASTLHRIVDACLCEAIGQDAKTCARTLRNTFAMHVIAEHGPELAEQYLGLRGDQGMRRYLAAFKRLRGSAEL